VCGSDGAHHTKLLILRNISGEPTQDRVKSYFTAAIPRRGLDELVKESGVSTSFYVRVFVTNLAMVRVRNMGVAHSVARSGFSSLGMIRSMS